MSRAGACVRFDDGTVKWCLYNGTVDLLVPRLFDDPVTPWDAYYRRTDEDFDLWPEPEGEPERVVIYSDYGSGWWWEGTATRNTVIGPQDPWDDDIETHHERPEWVTFTPPQSSSEPPPK